LSDDRPQHLAWAPLSGHEHWSGPESLSPSLDNVKIQNNVHNKGFVFDGKTVVVSSMNWSGEGVLNNRDAGVIIENTQASQYHDKIFMDDWANHSDQSIT